MGVPFTDDPRRPIEKLRRRRLWDIADHYGVPYPPGASKEKMIQLLEGSEIDVTKPIPDDDRPLQWERTPVEDENGVIHHQLTPKEPKAGGLNNSQVQAHIARKEEQKQRKREEQENNEIEALRRENAEQKEQINELTGSLNRLMERMDRMMDGQVQQPAAKPDDQEESSDTGETPDLREKAHKELSEEETETPDPGKTEEKGEGKKQEPSSTGKPKRQMSGLQYAAELRRQCKEAGIEVKRTDKIKDLEAKLNGKDETGTDDDEPF